MTAPGDDTSQGLAFEIHRQPDETTCGPTCLHAVYRFWGDDLSLKDVIAQTQRLDGGGTLAVMLGCHALERGYRVRLTTFNLRVFDPSWFREGAPALAEKLAAQAAACPGRAKLQVATRAYLRFLELGGSIEMRDLSRALVRKPLRRGVPVLTGLSSTFLYQEERQDSHANRADDLAGEPQGHFVVLCGYERASKTVTVADPWFPNPVAKQGKYSVGIDRVLSSILLGVLTYDANLLVIEPRKSPAPARRSKEQS